MASLYTKAKNNRWKSFALLTTFFLLIIAIGWALSYIYENPSFFSFFLFLSIGISFFSYWFSDKLVLNISKARQLKFEENKEVYRLVENLCITAGLPMPKIYVIDDPSPNAFATGRNKDHSVIALTTGIINKLERSELEGVIAHELSHIGNRDILLATLVTVLVGGIVMLADHLRYASFFRSNDRKSNNPFSIILLIFVMIIAPLFAYILKFAVSRQREYLADTNAALLTRYPEGLASALEKISSDPNPVKSANNSTAHLFIASPFRGKRLSKVFATHPPIGDRVNRLRNLDINKT